MLSCKDHSLTYYYLTEFVDKGSSEILDPEIFPGKRFEDTFGIKSKGDLTEEYYGIDRSLTRVTIIK